MAKRVHFAPTNTVFAHSRTPSPTLSETSSPSDSSSDAVSTPPPEVEYDPATAHHHHHHQPHPQQHFYPQSPYPTHVQEVVLHPAAAQHLHQPQIHYTPPQAYFQQPEAIVPKEHMNVHTLLAYRPDSEFQIHYDLSTSHVWPGPVPVPPEDLAAAATEPPLPFLIIRCPHLAWDIHVAPSPVPPPSPYTPEGVEQRDYVTVHDVLRCLHRALRQSVSPDDYQSLAPLGPARDAVDTAYHTRCAKIEDPAKRLRDESFGVRKIDFLHGMNMFRGLAWTLTAPHIWELNVTYMPSPVTMHGMHLVAPMMAIAASAASVI